MVDNQHRIITGQRDLTLDEIELMNAIKALEVPFAKLFVAVMAMPESDKASAVLGRRHHEDALYRLMKSVGRPQTAYDEFDRSTTRPQPPHVPPGS
jgi:hypothetical protein